MQSASTSVSVVDSPRALFGQQTVPLLGPGATVAVQIPLRLDRRNNPLAPALGAGAIAGAHAFTVYALGPGLPTPATKPLPVLIPKELCAAAVQAAAPATAAAAAAADARQAAEVKAATDAYKQLGATPKPGVEQSSSNRSNAAARIATARSGVEQSATNQSNSHDVFIKPAIPTNLKTVTGSADCLARLTGLLGGFLCTDLLKSGDLLLGWEWQPETGPENITGYRVYRIVNGVKQLVNTGTSRDMKIADLKKPADGYTGKCYAVSAYTGKQESELSRIFCAAGNPTPSVARFGPSQVWTTVKYRETSPLPGAGFKPWDLTKTNRVGYDYSSHESLIEADTVENIFYRSAYFFDLTSLRYHIPIAATLRVDTFFGVQCITDVGTGTGPWWQEKPGWLEGQFQPVPQRGAAANLDVLPAVKQWLRGEPNYGFVLKNRNENLKTFANDICTADIRGVALEITYY